MNINVHNLPTVPCLSTHDARHAKVERMQLCLYIYMYMNITVHAYKGMVRINFTISIYTRYMRRRSGAYAALLLYICI